MKKVLILFSLVSGVGAMAQQPMVQVVGKGSVVAIPDWVTISVEVETEGNDPRKVKEENDKAIANVVSYLKKSDIPAKDYQTEYVNLSKQTDYNTKKSYFRASQTLSILLRDVKKYDSVMANLMDSGINRINNVSFEVSNKEQYEAQARKKAMENAKQKAAEYATYAGQSVGKALSISEESVSHSTPRALAMPISAKSSVAKETLMVGSMEISATVHVTYELK